MDLRAMDGLGALGDEVLRMQHAAFAVEAALIGDDRIPPLHETLADLLACELRWLVAFDGDQTIGAIGFAETADGEIELDRLMVHPEHHRRGVGRALVTQVVRLAEARPIVVSTGRANQPARALYESERFVHHADVEVIPDLWVSRYRRAGEPVSR